MAPHWVLTISIYSIVLILLSFIHTSKQTCKKFPNALYTTVITEFKLLKLKNKAVNLLTQDCVVFILPNFTNFKLHVVQWYYKVTKYSPIEKILVSSGEEGNGGQQGVEIQE